MANLHTTLSELFTDIANAIRNKMGGSSPIVADDFPDAISLIQTGITPTGTKNITNTLLTDVTNYANAQVVDSNLVAENIKHGVDILGLVGSFAGGGGNIKEWEYTAVDPCTDETYVVFDDPFLMENYYNENLVVVTILNFGVEAYQQNHIASITMNKPMYTVVGEPCYGFNYYANMGIEIMHFAEPLNEYGSEGKTVIDSDGNMLIEFTAYCALAEGQSIQIIAFLLDEEA